MLSRLISIPIDACITFDVTKILMSFVGGVEKGGHGWHNHPLEYYL